MGEVRRQSGDAGNWGNEGRHPTFQEIDMTNENVIQMPQQQPAPARFTITAQLHGFPIEISFEGKIESLKNAVAKLVEIGAVPTSAPSLPIQAPQPEAAPKCKYHGPMKQGKRGWFCPRKLSDGSYCEEKA
jgi:hypothetical protein